MHISARIFDLKCGMVTDNLFDFKNNLFHMNK